jgi:hypothetical protein
MINTLIAEVEQFQQAEFLMTALSRKFDYTHWGSKPLQTFRSYLRFEIFIVMKV